MREAKKGAREREKRKIMKLVPPSMSSSDGANIDLASRAHKVQKRPFFPLARCLASNIRYKCASAIGSLHKTNEFSDMQLRGTGKKAKN